MFFVRVMFYFSVLLRSKWLLHLLDSQLRLYFQVTQPEGALSVEFLGRDETEQDGDVYSGSFPHTSVITPGNSEKATSEEDICVFYKQ